MSTKLRRPAAGRYISTMIENIYKPKDWKLFATLFAGKMLGLGAVIAAMVLLPELIGGTSAHAADTYTAHETAVINSLNTVWTLVAAFLVFGMQAGFVMLEAGFARRRETVNILVECVLDTAICGISF